MSQLYRRNRAIALLSWVCLAVAAGPLVAAPPEVHGKLDKVGPFRVLRVWGTPQEMGFAHGYLMADDIVVVMNESAAAIPEQGRSQYDAFIGAAMSFVELPDRTRQELEGMLTGIQAAKGELPTIKSLGRPIGFNDLAFHNAGDLVRAYGCSGFTVWGKAAGDDGVITTRNFDYPPTSRKMLAEQFLLVREPTGRKQVLSITWPGYIGTFTGVNEDGVCGFMHDGTGDGIDQPDRKRVPVALVIADVLERTTPETAIKDMEKALKTLPNYPFSYLIRMATPRVDGSTPGYVFRVDKSGVSHNPPGKNACITTNHYLTPAGRAVPEAGDWSRTRYDRLEKRVDAGVTRASAWAAQDSVAVSGGHFPTLHTLVVYPEKRELDLAFAAYKGSDCVSATKSKPTTIKFDDLFKRP